jgi:hypothetical protein
MSAPANPDTAGSAGLEALAERVEVATGPDRELDKAIVHALCPQAIIGIYIEGDDEPTVFHAQPLVRDKQLLPPFTASLDAAMTLINWRDLREWGYSFGLETDCIDQSKWCARFDQQCDNGDTILATAATAALALCAAALREAAALSRAGKSS